MKKLYLFTVSIAILSLLTGCEPPIQKTDPLALDNITQVAPNVIKTDGAIYQIGDDPNLYGSSRAHRVGDLLTVHLVEDTSATDNVSSKTSRSTTLSDDLTLKNPPLSGDLQVSGTNKADGSGTSNQSNKISGDLTVTVIRTLGEHKLLVKGYKTITLSNGVEKVGISGVVREEDINTLDNSVNSSQIADAHIAYLSRGDLNTSAQKGWLTRVFTSFFWPV